jgi:iron complex outermembrane receptor protein
MTYGNWNGLHISRAIIDENIAKAALSQGTGALGVPSNSDLGPAIQFTSVDPSLTPGVTAAQSFGSNAAIRTYAAINTGELPSNTRIMLSTAFQKSDKWKGVGNQHYLQINFKLVQDIGAAKLTGFVNYSDRAEVDYQDLSKEYIAKLGYNFDNYGNWAEAIAAARGVYTHGENTTSDPLDAAYYGGSGVRKDILGGLTLETPLSDDLTMKTTLYAHQDVGRGLWFTPYVPSPDGSPISLRTSEYFQDRAGLTNSLTYTTGNNTLTGGVWAEREGFRLARRYYATTVDSPVYSLYDFPKDPFYTQWAFHFDIGVYQAYIQDTYNLTDNLSVNAGFKAISNQIRSNQVVGSGYSTGSVTAASPFLPQVGLNYKLTPDDEIFADIADNLRSFQAGGPGYGAAPFQVSQSVFNATKSHLHPETSLSEEVGYRLKRSNFAGDVDFYHVDFHNRLLAIAQCAGIVGCPNTLANVGSVTTNGVEIAGSLALPYGFTWYNAGTINDSQYNNNVTTGGVTYVTKGKTVVDSPKAIYSTDIGYRNGAFFAHLTGYAMSGRYYTYTNDGEVGGRMTWDLSTGYDLHGYGLLHNARLQLNVTNLFGKRYVSSLGTNGFTMTDPLGEGQTLQVGPPRAVFGSLTAKF